MPVPDGGLHPGLVQVCLDVATVVLRPVQLVTQLLYLWTNVKCFSEKFSLAVKEGIKQIEALRAFKNKRN